MSLQIEPSTDEPIVAAKKAIAAVLNRIEDDENIGYHMGVGTETFSKLVQAGALLWEKPVANIQAQFTPKTRFPSRRDIPRSRFDDIRYLLADGENERALSALKYILEGADE